MYKANKSRYGKLIEQIENDMLQKKDLFQNLLQMHVGSWQDGKTGGSQD